MKATNWEFTNRALVFGMILGFSGILVLGIRGGAGCLCHNLKTEALFRDTGGKAGLVLCILGGSSKEEKFASLTAPMGVVGNSD
jgi:hypothetical protein